MTDPGACAFAPTSSPLTKEYLEEIISREKTGRNFSAEQSEDKTALNLRGRTFRKGGVLEKYKVEMIGASLRAIKVAEDRLWFQGCMPQNWPGSPGLCPGEQREGCAAPLRSIWDSRW